MGTLTDNLLKLTEFPFSYSFIGLLALIFGGGTNFGDEDFFARLGPLLILMGFIATTLSVTDPIGALQKLLLKGWRSKSLNSIEELKIKRVSADELESIRIFGMPPQEWDETSVAVIVHTFRGSGREARTAPGKLRTHTRQAEPPIQRHTDLNDVDRYFLTLVALFLRDSTLTTTWIVREIDKITSMIYFIIVLITFMSALFLVPDFEDKLFVTIQDGNQSEGDSNTITITGSQISDFSEQAQEGEEQQRLGQTLQTETTTGTDTGITEITGKDLLIHHITAALAATKSNYTQTAVIEVNAAIEALRQLEERGNLYTRVAVFVFSFTALLGILYMLYQRLRSLRKNARTTFMYLLVREAYVMSRRLIKLESETFDKSMQEVEQYLNNGDWTLALFSTDQLRSDYGDLVSEKIKEYENEAINEKEDRGGGIY